MPNNTNNCSSNRERHTTIKTINKVLRYVCMVTITINASKILSLKSKYSFMFPLINITTNTSLQSGFIYFSKVFPYTSFGMSSISSRSVTHLVRDQSDVTREVVSTLLSLYLSAFPKSFGQC